MLSFAFRPWTWLPGWLRSFASSPASRQPSRAERAVDTRATECEKLLRVPSPLSTCSAHRPNWIELVYDSCIVLCFLVTLLGPPRCTRCTLNRSSLDNQPEPLAFTAPKPWVQVAPHGLMTHPHFLTSSRPLGRSND